MFIQRTSFSTSKNIRNDQETSPDHSVTFDLEQARREILQQWMVAESKTNGQLRAARYCCITYDDIVRAYQTPTASWHWLDRELSSNVAGETGAVYVYRGARAASQWFGSLSPTALEFCRVHEQTEAGHLALFTHLVPNHKHTKLLPLWRMAGWMVGFLPTALGGSKGLYVTVEAIESFVEEHFEDQIRPLQQETKETPELLKILQHCCEDEVHHKTEAAAKLLEGDTTFTAWWVQPWRRIVHLGSAAAAEVARRI